MEYVIYENTIEKFGEQKHFATKRYGARKNKKQLKALLKILQKSDDIKIKMINDLPIYYYKNKMISIYKNIKNGGSPVNHKNFNRMSWDENPINTYQEGNMLDLMRDDLEKFNSLFYFEQVKEVVK